MHTRAFQLPTTLLLLALTALVGGVGTGLHSWFGCCCKPSLCRYLSGSCDGQFTWSTPRGANSLQLVGDASRSHGEPEQPSEDTECPICSLLLRYQSTSIVTAYVMSDDAMLEWLGEGDAPTSRFTFIDVRARGPPSFACASFI